MSKIVSEITIISDCLIWRKKILLELENKQLITIMLDEDSLFKAGDIDLFIKGKTLPVFVRKYKIRLMSALREEGLFDFIAV